MVVRRENRSIVKVFIQHSQSLFSEEGFIRLKLWTLLNLEKSNKLPVKEWHIYMNVDKYNYKRE